MFVSMWMTKDVLTVTPDTPLTTIANLMAQHRIRRLPVMASTASDSPLLGLVSSQDVLHAFPIDVNPFAFIASDKPPQQLAALPNIKLTAANIMVCDPLTTTPEEPIEHVAKLMRDRKIGALPVMRRNVLVGLITESDIFRAFVSIFDPGTHGVRVTFDNAHGDDVFPLIAEVTKRHQLRVTSFVSLLKHERPVCVVQVIGTDTDAMLDDLWKSHHQVISAIQLGEPEPEPVAKPHHIYYKG